MGKGACAIQITTSLINGAFWLSFCPVGVFTLPQDSTSSSCKGFLLDFWLPFLDAGSSFRSFKVSSNLVDVPESSYFLDHHCKLSEMLNNENANLFLHLSGAFPSNIKEELV